MSESIEKIKAGQKVRCDECRKEMRSKRKSLSGKPIPIKKWHIRGKFNLIYEYVCPNGHTKLVRREK